MNNENFQQKIEPKVIVPFLPKGGTGKTTISAHVGYYLSKLGKTLLIDADNQANLTANFLNKKEFLKKSGGATLVDLLNKNKLFSECIFKPRDSLENNLYMIGLLNNNGLKEFIEEKFINRYKVVEQIIIKAKEEGFKFIILDPPANYNFFSQILITNSNLNISVIEPEAFSYEALPILFEILKEIQECNGINIYKKLLIINKYNSNNTTHVYYKKLFDSSPYKNYFIIPDGKAIVNACSRNMLLHEYRPNHPVNQVFKSIATIINNLAL